MLLDVNNCWKIIIINKFQKEESLCVTRIEYINHWCLWANYIAHFSMNWSNYIIMQWLPTYLARTLGADVHSMSITAIPYIVSSVCGIGKYKF